jgi:hypothetical protein
MGAAGPAIIFVMLFAASIIVGVCVLAYAARCVRPLSIHRVLHTMSIARSQRKGAIDEQTTIRKVR